MKHPRQSAFPGPAHDHATCLADILERARQAFERTGLRLTPLRARVLEAIASSHAAVGAYDLIDRLSAGGKRLAPISVYRAIDALLEAGLVHKLETKNAFFVCHTPHTGNHAQLVLACNSCGTVAEVPARTAFAAIGAAAEATGFALAGAIVEARGTCRHCAGEAGEAHKD